MRAPGNYRTAGLWGLDTSMEDFGFGLSSAVTTWAFSSESDELPQVTVRPDSRTSLMRRDCRPSSDRPFRAACRQGDRNGGHLVEQRYIARIDHGEQNLGRHHLLVWYATPDLSTRT